MACLVIYGLVFLMFGDGFYFLALIIFALIFLPLIGYSQELVYGERGFFFFFKWGREFSPLFEASRLFSVFFLNFGF